MVAKLQEGDSWTEMSTRIRYCDIVTADPFKLPTWTILIPTLGERRVLLERLLAGLLPQTEAFAGRVMVTAWLNNGKPALPEIRQTLIETAATDYISFVDDDDLVSPDYVPSIMAALDDQPDYVGFQVQCYSDGVPTAVAYHGLGNGRWRNTPGRYFRDISHINPIKTSIARKVTFRKAKAGGPEDRVWADQLRRKSLLKSEVVIDRILYHYLYSTSTRPGEGSRWELPKLKLIQAGPPRSPIEHPNFAWSLNDLARA
jgi:hypothetical protein